VIQSGRSVSAAVREASASWRRNGEQGGTLVVAWGVPRDRPSALDRRTM